MIIIKWARMIYAHGTGKPSAHKLQVVARKPSERKCFLALPTRLGLFLCINLFFFSLYHALFHICFSCFNLISLQPVGDKQATVKKATICRVGKRMLRICTP